MKKSDRALEAMKKQRGKDGKPLEIEVMLRYLKKHPKSGITSLETAIKLKNPRASSSVSILRHQYGLNITCDEEPTQNGRTKWVYRLIDEEVDDVQVQ